MNGDLFPQENEWILFAGETLAYMSGIVYSFSRRLSHLILNEMNYQNRSQVEFSQLYCMQLSALHLRMSASNYRSSNRNHLGFQCHCFYARNLKQLWFLAFPVKESEVFFFPRSFKVVIYL
jgi:hypothetical protein